MTFRRITEMEEPYLIPGPKPVSQNIGPSGLLHKTSKRKCHALDEELIPFRKVRIRSMVPLMLAVPKMCYLCGIEGDNDDIMQCAQCTRSAHAGCVDFDHNSQNPPLWCCDICRPRLIAFAKRCHSCNRTETPEWRRGPDGARTLCNACGLRKFKNARMEWRNTDLVQITQN